MIPGKVAFSNNTLLSNVAFNNANGIALGFAGNNILASNLSYKNANYGMILSGVTNADNTLIAESYYSNATSYGGDLYSAGGTTGKCVCVLQHRLFPIAAGDAGGLRHQRRQPLF